MHSFSPVPSTIASYASSMAHTSAPGPVFGAKISRWCTSVRGGDLIRSGNGRVRVGSDLVPLSHRVLEIMAKQARLAKILNMTRDARWVIRGHRTCLWAS